MQTKVVSCKLCTQKLSQLWRNFAILQFFCFWIFVLKLKVNKLLASINWFYWSNRFFWYPSCYVSWYLCHTTYVIKGQIHLTGAATNPWMIFESDDSFIRFEIGTNLSDLVKFYSTFLLYILHCLTGIWKSEFRNCEMAADLKSPLTKLTK